jgi:serine/threonine protein kinase
VLLDQNGNAKVADFGTVREGIEEGGANSAMRTHASTAVIVGTHAYMPPEYSARGFVSVKVR